MSTPANFDGSAAAAASPAGQESTAPSPEIPALSETSGPSAPTLPRNQWSSTTYLLIIANALIFYAMVAYSIYDTGVDKFLNTRIAADFDSAIWLRWGSDFGPFTLSGQFWRVLTAIFVHANFVHLGSNMLFLWGLGRYLDRLFTRGQAFAIYLLTGAAGGICSLAWHPLINSAGASGAIYGQAGVLVALLCFGRLNLPRRDIRNILLWIIFLMPIQLLWRPLSRDTNYAAHIGGILCGFVIGILLAPAFRAPLERPARRYGVLKFAGVALMVIFAIVTQVRRESALEYLKASPTTVTDFRGSSNHPPQVARVFLELKGDPKLVRHFSGLLHAELENDGIAVTNSAPEADAVVHGEILVQREHINLSLGVVQMHLNGQKGLQDIHSCAALSTTSGNDDLFHDLFGRSAASGAAGKIRQRDPDARTVLLDPKSDMSASSAFAEELPSALKKSDFSVVQSGPADIALHLALVSQNVPVEEDVAAYDIRVVATNGGQFYASNGSAILFAKLAGEAPAACPEQLADLKWLDNNAGLYSAASTLANALYSPEPETHTNPSVSKPKPKS